MQLRIANAATGGTKTACDVIESTWLRHQNYEGADTPYITDETLTQKMRNMSLIKCGCMITILVALCIFGLLGIYNIINPAQVYLNSGTGKSNTDMKAQAKLYINGNSILVGTVSLTQKVDEKTKININIFGQRTLDSEGSKHGFHIHEYGDLGSNCMDTGGTYNPYKKLHGDRTSKERQVGDLGNLVGQSGGMFRGTIEDD